MTEDSFKLAIRGRGWARGETKKAYRPLTRIDILYDNEGKPKKLTAKQKRRQRELARFMYEELKIYLKEDIQQEKLEKMVSEFKAKLNEEQVEIFDKTRKYGLVGILGEPKRIRGDYLSYLRDKNLDMLRDIYLRVARYFSFLDGCNSYREVCKRALEFNGETKTPIDNFFEKFDNLMNQTRRIYVEINKTIEEVNGK